MTKPLAFRTAWVSDVGRVRELNEDSVLTKPEIGLWAVADGMGGYRGGDVASRAVVEALKALAPTASAALFLDAFEQKVVRVNSDLRALALARESEVVGTTLVALLVHSEHFACVWCGDSRAYLRRDGAVSQISRDHSEVQELIDQGLLDEEKAKTWPRRNVVTRALGATDKPELDLVDGRIYSGDNSSCVATVSPPMSPKTKSRPCFPSRIRRALSIICMLLRSIAAQATTFRSSLSTANT